MIQNQQMHEVDIFLARVEKQIKYKPMIPEIKKELLDHIEDKTSDYIENGFTKEKAICETMKDMGTPENVSNSFNTIYHTRPTWNMILPILGLFFIGFLRTCLYYGEYNPMRAFLLGGYFFFAIPVLFVTLYFIYPKMINCHKKIFVFTSLLCIFSFLINARSLRNIVVVLNYRISISSINLFLLLLFIPAFSMIAYYLSNYGLKGFLFSVAIYAFIVLLIDSIYQYDFHFIYKIIFMITGLFTLIYIAYKKYMSANIKKAIAFILLSFSIISMIWIHKSSGIFTEYIKSCFEPEKMAENVFDDSYNSILIKELLGRTKLIGKVELTSEDIISYRLGTWHFDRIDESTKEYLMQFLNEPTLDSILPKYTFNNYRVTYWFLYYGFIPSILLLIGIVAVYALLFYKILQIKKQLGKLISLASYLALLFQTIFYILGNFGYQFGKFGTLPFISEGIVSISANVILVGFIISAYRFDNVTLVKDTIKIQYKIYLSGKLAYAKKGMKQQ